MELDDIAGPVELNGDRCSFLFAVQRAFPLIGRVGLFSLWRPEPHTGSIRGGEFQWAGDESPGWSRIVGWSEIRDDVVVMHPQGHGLSDFGILNADLSVDVDDRDRQRQR